MDYIYTRVSTDKQTTQNQETLTLKYPSATLVSETASGVKHRPILQTLLQKLQPGDRLIVAALDRLGRRTTEILTLIENLTKKQITLISEREGVDYSTPMGRLVTQILVSVAELERSLISERTKAGMQLAKSNGKRIGAPKNNQRRKGKMKTHAPEFVARLRRLGRALPPKDVALELNISLSSTYELLKRYAA